uniref:Uncharacterized protein n=1 Tax=Medicago truncatula TaxID=3880 RepID=I3S2M1_MEDTR|nr:unknown [Medicago truncatula]
MASFLNPIDYHCVHLVSQVLQEQNLYHQKQGSDGFIHPAILLEKMTKDNTSTQKCHKQVHRNNRSMIGSG